MNGNEIGSIIQHNRNNNTYGADALTHTLNNSNKVKDHEAVARSGAAGFSLNIGDGMGQGMMPLTDVDKKSAASALRQVSSGVPEDVMKDKMIVMSNTMSDEAYKKAAENGYSLSDMDPEEAVTIADEIKITMAKAGVVIKGYNDDLTTEQLATFNIGKDAANRYYVLNPSEELLLEADAVQGELLYFKDMNSKCMKQFNRDARTDDYGSPLYTLEVNDSVLLADLSDSQLAQLGVSESGDVMIFNGKICFRYYVAELDDYFDTESRKLSIDLLN